MKRTLLGVGNIVFGVAGVLSQMPPLAAISTEAVGPQHALPLVGMLLSVALAASGLAMLLHSEWGTTEARRICLALILVNVLSIAIVLMTRDPAHSSPLFLLLPVGLCGVLWPALVWRSLPPVRPAG
jgi:hypothetical protein